MRHVFKSVRRKTCEEKSCLEDLGADGMADLILKSTLKDYGVKLYTDFYSLSCSRYTLEYIQLQLLARLMINLHITVSPTCFGYLQYPLSVRL
jgi:hypothetical protein